MFMLMLSVLSVVIGVAALAIQLYDCCRNSPTPTGSDRHFTNGEFARRGSLYFSSAAFLSDKKAICSAIVGIVSERRGTST